MCFQATLTVDGSPTAINISGAIVSLAVKSIHHKTFSAGDDVSSSNLAVVLVNHSAFRLACKWLIRLKFGWLVLAAIALLISYC